MKTAVLILLDILHLQGAEKLAVNVAVNLKRSEHFEPYVCVTRYGGVLEKTLRDNEIEYIILDRKKFFEVYKFKKALKFIKDKDIKLIHAHKIGSNLWGSLLGKYLNIPAISHYHGYAKEAKRSTQLIANKVISELSSEIITVSESLRTNLIEKEGMIPSKIRAIVNGIDYVKYEIAPDQELKKKIGINPASKVVGIVGALTKVKDHELFLRAANQLLKNKKDIQFLIVGDGPERDRLKELADSLGIIDHCRFLGFRQDIPNLLSIVDIAALSSRSEGLPLVLLEYMSAAKPVVSTNVGGVSEVIEDNVNGFLTPPGDYTALAHKISLLIEDPGLAKSMGLNGLKKVEEKFSEKVMMEKIQDIYEKLL